MHITHHTLIHDAGHAWLAVRASELQRLAIEPKISSCSPEKDGLRFLEIDCDMAVYYHALDAFNEPVPDVRDLNVDNFWRDVIGE